MRRIAFLGVTCLSFALTQHSVYASDEPSITQARELFVAAAELARESRWADALQQFDRSQRIHPHPATTYNIGVCHRALGRFVLAEQSFQAALRDNDQAGGQVLTPDTKQSILVLLAEVRLAIATLNLSVHPIQARLLVNGLPLAKVSTDAEIPTFIVASSASEATEPLSQKIQIRVDPGTHVIILSSKGFASAVLRETLAPGDSRTLSLNLTQLAGSLRIDASEPRAAVSVDGIDVGVAPLNLSRPPGRYRVQVRKHGFVGYETDAILEPGETVTLKPRLRLEERGLTSRWWFWTGLGVLVVGTAATTWYATRPEPSKPPLNGGGLGWTVQVP